MSLDRLPTGMGLTAAPVLLNRVIAPDHFLTRLKAPQVARRARPGQFLHLICPPAADAFPQPMLRRPFSIFDADTRSGTVDFIYKRVGIGTEALARVRRGDRLDLLAPLGLPFDPPAPGREAILVGGGVGIPPLYFLAKALKAAGIAVRVVLGARKKGWVICVSDFRKLGVPVQVATDDGSMGHRGSVVELAAAALKRREDRSGIQLFICGPTPMMAAAARFARREGVPAQVSLEERMGCGLGVCWGCCVEVTTEPKGTHARFQRVCTEGPVFPAEAVSWR
ncbi:MAG: dihydroorotate dehydrogenase electron transfer subunit [Candidatus Omnitrophica bacterium CG11_big_fil_rev_8_21_14_0_20_64_10]|nr:MAG: dihydroorotate dehydrogenase electron transfer subunit [Candidatus Omnitrophica bacterium CG11_big_fil_rev_8_21_14_0_20_64_10]